MLLVTAALLAGCTNEDIVQGKDRGTETPKSGVVFATNDTKISAKRRFIDENEFADAKTRTNIKHTPGNGADAYWTSDDFIWVKDKHGNWQQSTAITLNDGGASAEFTLPGSMSDYADGCEVRYTGPNSYIGPSAEYVTISNTATYTTPNDFSKAGDWATAVRAQHVTQVIPTSSISPLSTSRPISAFCPVVLTQHLLPT